MLTLVVLLYAVVGVVAALLRRFESEVTVGDAPIGLGAMAFIVLTWPAVLAWRLFEAVW